MNMTREAISPIVNNTAAIGENISGVINSAETWDCNCGNKNITGNFCNNCGAKKPVPVETWDCVCGNKNIVGNFCNNCGAKKPAPAETWDCVCGNKNITGNFCNNCGKKKGE